MVDIVVDAMVQWADAMVDTLLDTLLDTIVDAIVDDATVDAMQWLRSSVSQKSLGLPLHLPWHVSVLSAVCCVLSVGYDTLTVHPNPTRCYPTISLCAFVAAVHVSFLVRLVLNTFNAYLACTGMP